MCRKNDFDCRRPKTSLLRLLMGMVETETEEVVDHNPCQMVLICCDLDQMLTWAYRRPNVSLYPLQYFCIHLGSGHVIMWN